MNGLQFNLNVLNYYFFFFSWTALLSFVSTPLPSSWKATQMKTPRIKFATVAAVIPAPVVPSSGERGEGDDRGWGVKGAEGWENKSARML